MALMVHRRGVLEKRGHRMSFAWRLRSFVLMGPCLIYSKRGSDMKPKGIAVLMPTTTVMDCDSPASDGPAPIASETEFVVLGVRDSRNYHLRASSEDERREWVAAIRAAVRQLQQRTRASVSE